MQVSYKFVLSTVFSFSCFFCFTALNSGIISRTVLTSPSLPLIILFGDNHNLSSQEQKETLLRSLSAQPTTVLIEDRFTFLGYDINDFNDLPFLSGLTQQIHSSPQQSTVQNIEIRNAIARATDFFSWKNIPPFWGGKNFLSINKSNFCFFSTSVNELIEEIKKIKKEIKESEQPILNPWQEKRFKEQYKNLKKGMSHDKESPILNKALQLLWQDLAQIVIPEAQQELNEIQEKITLFIEKITAYINGSNSMSKEEWETASCSLIKQLTVFLQANNLWWIFDPSSTLTREQNDLIFTLRRYQLYALIVSLSDMMFFAHAYSNVLKAIRDEKPIVIIAGNTHVSNLTRMLKKQKDYELHSKICESELLDPSLLDISLIQV